MAGERQVDGYRFRQAQFLERGWEGARGAGGEGGVGVRWAEVEVGGDVMYPRQWCVAILGWVMLRTVG